MEGKPQRVFHIVFSHPREDVPGRKNPKDLTRQEFADKLDSVFQDATRDSAAQILKLSVFQELRENEEPHMHAAMQVSEPIRHTRLFRTLREKHGMFIHLEDGHRTYWGITWRCRPRASRTSTPARGLARAIRPWWSDILKGAVNSVKERVHKWLAEVHGIKLGRVQPLSHGQFVDYIVANKISDKSILYSHLEQRASDKIEPVREFFFRHFKDIPTLLATVWDIQASTDNLKRLKMSPRELVCAAARDKCVCDGLWIPLMRDNLRVQCENFPPQMSQEEKQTWLVAWRSCPLLELHFSFPSCKATSVEIQSAFSGCNIALKLPYLLCERDKADTYRLIRGHLSAQGWMETSTIPAFIDPLRL